MQVLDGSNELDDAAIGVRTDRCLEREGGTNVRVNRRVRWSYAKHLVPLFETRIDHEKMIEVDNGVDPSPERDWKQRLRTMTAGTKATDAEIFESIDRV